MPGCRSAAREDIKHITGDALSISVAIQIYADEARTQEAAEVDSEGLGQDAPIRALAISMTREQQPVREMLMSRIEFPWKRTRGAW